MKSIIRPLLAAAAAALIVSAALADYTQWTWTIGSNGGYWNDVGVTSTTWDGDIYFDAGGGLVSNNLVPHRGKNLN